MSMSYGIVSLSVNRYYHFQFKPFTKTFNLAPSFIRFVYSASFPLVFSRHWNVWHFNVDLLFDVLNELKSNAQMIVNLHSPNLFLDFWFLLCGLYVWLFLIGILSTIVCFRVFASMWNSWNSAFTWPSYRFSVAFVKW